MGSEAVLSLLGLSLRGGNLAVGEEPVEAAARGKKARLLLLAEDAAPATRRRTERFAQMGQCLCLTLPFSKAELGQSLGRTSVAIAALTDTGLASAVTERLRQLDPARYAAAADQMALKARRAAQRRAERQAHEKNVRQGKKPVPAKRSSPPQEAVPSRAAGGPPPSRRGRTVPRDKGGTSCRPQGPRPGPYAHSRPVKKGKGSFRGKKQG